jgi:hypothetical protein
MGQSIWHLVQYIARVYGFSHIQAGEMVESADDAKRAALNLEIQIMFYRWTLPHNQSNRAINTKMNWKMERQAPIPRAQCRVDAFLFLKPCVQRDYPDHGKLGAKDRDELRIMNGTHNKNQK